MQPIIGSLLISPRSFFSKLIVPDLPIVQHYRIHTQHTIFSSTPVFAIMSWDIERRVWRVRPAQTQPQRWSHQTLAIRNSPCSAAQTTGDGVPPTDMNSAHSEVTSVQWAVTTYRTQNWEQTLGRDHQRCYQHTVNRHPTQNCKYMAHFETFPTHPRRAIHRYNAVT